MDNKRTSLGEGILNWPKKERVNDRYGLVGLWTESDVPRPETLKEIHNYGQRQQRIKLAHVEEGKHGRLVVEVLRTQKSAHIGDLFRGLFPSTPKVGETIVLGEGYVFYEEGNFIGLEPKEQRESDWLNPKMLYRVHEQYVELFFEEV